MNNKLTYGATALLALVVLGGAQGKIGADQMRGIPQSSLKAINSVPGRVVRFSDPQFQDAVMKAAKVYSPAELTEDVVAKIREVNIDKATIGSFQGAASLKELRKIFSMDVNLTCTSLSDLQHCAQLEELYLSNSGGRGSLLNFKDTFFFNLKTLYCQNQSLNDISNLSNLSNLKVVKLDNNFITDMSPLAAAKANGAELHLADQHYQHSLIKGPSGQHLSVPVPVKNIDGSIPKITPGPGVSLSSDGRYLEFTLQKNMKEYTFTWKGEDSFEGEGKIPVSVAHQDDQAGDTQVQFVHKSIPKSTWYGVIPATITLNDDVKQKDAVVKIVDGEQHKQPYQGEGSVDVRVRSENGFRLIDANHKDEAISYQFDEYGDGSKILKDGRKEEDLGRLDKNHTEFDSKVKVTGDAADGGTFVDVLHYRFTEE